MLTISPIQIIQTLSSIEWKGTFFTPEEIESLIEKRDTDQEDTIVSVAERLAQLIRVCACRIDQPMWYDITDQRAVLANQSTNPDVITILLVTKGTGSLSLTGCQRNIPLEKGTLVAYRSDTEAISLIAPDSPLTYLRTAIRQKML
jgi:hypothetical protein